MVSPRPFATRTVGTALALAALLGGACAPAHAPRHAPPPVHVVLAATTDLHGALEGRELRGDPPPWSGGLDVLAGYVDNLRSAHAGRVVVLDSGDLFQGSLASNLFEGEPVVKAYNEIGYVAAAVGNHEFDYGPVGEAAVPRDDREDPMGSLRRNAAEARFRFLAANVVEKATGRPPTWLQPSLVVEVGGVKVGIVGVATPETPSVTMPRNVEGLVFGDPVEATVRLARELRAQGADAVVVAAHLGGGCRDLDDPHDTSSCRMDSELFEYVSALPRGTADAVFGGHSHLDVRHFVNGVAVAQAGSHGRALAIVDLWVDPSAHRVLPERTRIRPLTRVCRLVRAGEDACAPREASGPGVQEPVLEGRPVRPRASVAAILKPYLDQVARKKAQSAGILLAGTFGRDYGRESALGNLMADGIRAAVPGAEVGLVNSGGLRANLSGPEVTYGDLYEVMPFDNLVASAKVTGAELREILRVANDGTHGLMQVSGLRVEIDAAKDMSRPPAERDRIVAVSLSDGTPLDPSRTYTVAMNDFLAFGGDGLKPVTDRLGPDRLRIYYERPPMRDVLAEVLAGFSAAGPLVPRLEGRVTVHNHAGSSRD